MSDDRTDLITIYNSPRAQAASKLLRRAGSIGLTALSSAKTRLQQQAQEHLLPRLEDASRWLLEPEHIEQAQQQLAKLASWGMKLGFEHDPKAALLFDFVNWIEQEHGRQAVIFCLAQHNPVVDGTLLDLVQTRFMTWPKLDEQTYQRKLSAVSCTFLGLLGALAQLEDRQAAPLRRSQEVLLARFVTSGIPERFYPLGHMAAGDKEVLARFERPAQPEQATSGALHKRAIGRLKAKLTGQTTPTTQPSGTANTRTDLTDQRPMGSDPHFQFLVNSYAFFMHTYMTRALIEQLPQVFTLARRAQAQDEPDQGADAPRADDQDVIIDM